MPEEELFFVTGIPGCVDYMDEYRVTLTSFGPTPNRVRQYLRQRFVYSLAEVMLLRIPVRLFTTINVQEAEVMRDELKSLGAEVRVVEEPGGPISESYPEVRIPTFRRIE